MENAFLICAAVGAAVLVLQLLLGAVGLGTHALDTIDADTDHDFLSIRALASGLAFFGLAGMWVQATGRGLWPALGVAALVGGLALCAVAWAMRQMLRLERDGTVRMEQAVGNPATVYLGIPGGTSPGKVHLTLGGRTVECQAVSDRPLPTGTPVVVVDVLGPGTLEVAPSPLLGGPNDVSR
ncbi:MAG TPA: hypothetical protein VF584_10940 [Longimicrobium sp.]